MALSSHIVNRLLVIRAQISKLWNGLSQIRIAGLAISPLTTAPAYYLVECVRVRFAREGSVVKHQICQGLLPREKAIR